MGGNAPLRFSTLPAMPFLDHPTPNPEEKWPLILKGHLLVTTMVAMIFGVARPVMEATGLANALPIMANEETGF